LRKAAVKIVIHDWTRAEAIRRAGSMWHDDVCMRCRDTFKDLEDKVNQRVVVENGAGLDSRDVLGTTSVQTSQQHIPPHDAPLPESEEVSLGRSQ
jgi:hypothetical protein